MSSNNCLIIVSRVKLGAKENSYAGEVSVYMNDQ